MTTPWLTKLRARVDGRAVDLPELLTAIVNGAAQELGAARATLYLVDRARNMLVSHVAHLPELPRIELGTDEGIAGYVARTGQAVAVSDVSRDPRFTARVDAVTGFVTRSVCAVPVRAEGEVLAVLQVLNCPEGFGPADIAALEPLAWELALALEATHLPALLSPDATRLPAWRFNQVIGDSPGMRLAYERVDRAAHTEATVLVRGETGTGKELVARAVHDNSARREHPFVKVDCAALPENLVENELFGHERGAFTGADRTQDGKVAAAQGGTIFLDEVGELPLPAQGRLLRLLQDRVYYRVGGSKELKADVRFVAATHQPLEQRVTEGAFRQDLYFRLRVVEISLPPLRDRGPEDLDRLIDHLVYRFRREHRRPGLVLSPAARAHLHGWAWPGNVRELEHTIESAVVLCQGTAIEAAELPTWPRMEPGGGFSAGVRPLDELTGAYARWVLEQCGGNRSEAARRLRVGRNTLARLLAR